MIFFVHRKGKVISRILEGTKILKLEKSNICSALWEIAEKYPDEKIFWVEEELFDLLNLRNLDKIFSHERIMASYAVNSNFFSNRIGYIDQMPFVNINRDVKYPTWLMSTDTGGIYSRTLLKFKPLFEKIRDFGYLLNSIAKIGQQNGLFCYSHPVLVKENNDPDLKFEANLRQEFEFVFSHYKTVWVYIFFWCLWRYEKKNATISLLKSLFGRKYFGAEVNLPNLKSSNFKIVKETDTIDVIIPTIGRPEYLKNVLEDLNKQSFPPLKVIVIEQRVEAEPISNLDNIENRNWKFQLKRITTEKIGVCNARNIGLEEVTSKWIFFADDDIRFSEDLLKEVLLETKKYDCEAINMNCKQKGEKAIFHKTKQWGSFGAGTSFVKSIFATQCNFSEVFEGGYGEDADYGLQLRDVGCDIVYHPEIKILHLKAPIGGFRKILNEGKKVNPKDEPKPAPTIMALGLRHFTVQQMKGFKVSLYLKYYRVKASINPFSFINMMNKRWKKSEEIAKNLLSKYAN